MSLQRAQHVQRLEKLRETGKQLFGPGLRASRGFRGACRLVHGVRSCILSRPAAYRATAGAASAEPASPRPRGGREAAGHLMGCPARVPGSGPGRANVRSPRPPAAGAPASTPGDDRYASGGGRQGAPLPRAPLTVVQGPPKLRVGGGELDAGRGAAGASGSAPPLHARP